MHDKTVTVFNRLPGDNGDTWFPTVLYNCNLITDKSAINQKYGSDCKDSAVLNVPFKRVSNWDVISGKLFKNPKEWAALADHSGSLTFQSGQLFDFFAVGDFGNEPVSDSDYPDGFFQHMNEKYDGVYTITSYSRFDVIPHFEIVGR